MAEIFNTYFSQIGNNLAENIPPSTRPFQDYLGIPNPNSIFFTPTHPGEILDIINNLKMKKSAGFDGIDNYLLKSIAPQIVDPLAYIFNLSLTTGAIPDIMKTAKVVPIFKKGNSQLTSNYRPTSLLTSLSKILENIVYKRTISFFNDHEVFNNSQFGFRKNHSTTHAILSLVDKVATAIDRSNHTVGIFLDFSKAFDTINHNILLYKLSHYGIRGRALEWFRNYLTNRSQFVFLNGCRSSSAPVPCGVPQGSLLGPLLFITYINDIQMSSDRLSFILFADDSNLFFSHSNPNHLLNTINTELIQVSDWIKANKLSLNVQKTNYMIYSNTISSLPGNIIFDNIAIQKVNSTKFLGVIIDNKLSWKLHIDNICKTVSRNVGVINKLKHFFPTRILFMLYSTLILPYINNGILAWGNANKSDLNRLLLIQKKAIRIVTNSGYRSHTNVLFFENNILKITDLYLFQLGQFMFKLNRHDLPHIFQDMFLKNSSVHHYPTRQTDSYHLPLTRTLFAYRTLTFTGPNFWNSLHKDYKDAPSLNTFKRKLKKLLLIKYKQAIE